MATEATQLIRYKWTWSDLKETRIQVSRLYPDGMLLLKEDPEEWIRTNPTHLLSVRRLELKLKRVETIGDSIRELSELTHLCIRWGTTLNSLPDFISLLHSLQHLELRYCHNVQELPANFGNFFLNGNLDNLRNLTHLILFQWYSIKSLTLPNCSITELSSLTTLSLHHCTSLTEIPSLPNLVDLSLQGCCSIQYLPEGLNNLLYLHLPLCYCSQERLACLSDFVKLSHLTISDCNTDPHDFRELPTNLDVLPQLLHFDIQHTKINWLSWSITKLTQLKFLLLPVDFKVETLPYHLNDSLVISVLCAHVRKTWKELKSEMELSSFSFVGVDPSTYLSLSWGSDNRLQIQENCSYESRLPAQILDLRLHDYHTENITDSIGGVAEVIHLYISSARYLSHLPQTLTRITHIYLSGLHCHNKFLFDSLGNLPTLRSLHLYLFDNIPPNISLPVSLKCLTLDDGNVEPLFDSLTKLSNLETLELIECDVEALPEDMKLVKLKLVLSNIDSLPTSLQYLEVLDSSFGKLVNMETLSVRCHKLKVLPSISGLHSLKKLHLKDCFSLKELPHNLDALVNLLSIDISGTRIKSLPDSVTNLQHLQTLILPKCFSWDSLPNRFKDGSMVIIDDTDDRYYKDEGYCNSDYESGGITSGSIPSVDEVPEHQSSYQQLNNLPDASAPLLGGSQFIDRNNPIDDGNNHDAGQNSQNQVIITSSSEGYTASMYRGLPSICTITDEDTFPEVSKPALQNGQSDTMALESGHEIIPQCDKRKGKRRIMEITLEDIKRLGRTMKLVEAAKELGVSRSTLKRCCRELKMEKWPSRRNRRHHHINMRNIGIEFPSTSELTTNLIGYEHNVGGFNDLNQHNLSNHVAPECNTIDNSTQNFTSKSAEELTGATQSQTNIHNLAPGCMNGTNLGTVPSNIQESRSLSNIAVKASYKKDKVMFKISTSASLDDLKKAVTRNLGIEQGKFKLNYQDHENDWLLLTLDEHLEEAISFSRVDRSNILRLKVIDL